MTPLTVSAGEGGPISGSATGNVLPALKWKISTPLRVVAWLSMAAALLSLIIGAALSLIVWACLA
jgi:hypothetical protein